MSTEINSRRFYIKTLGCKVNQYESQLVREGLIRNGFQECAATDIADIYIVNTCTVTRKADSESRHLIGLLHRSNPNARIVVTGCYVEKDADDVSFLPGVAHIVRNDEKGDIAAIIEGRKARKKASGRWQTISDFKDHVKAFIKIQDGCGNACSYCKVPLVRGSPRSKPLKYIIEEAGALIKRGFREIALTGICLGAWGEDLSPDAGLLDVLRALEMLEGDFRIRLSSIEPKYVREELVNYIASNKRICPHLHIPLQSGDDAILSRMGRPYSSGDFMHLVNMVKRIIPDIAITTDVIVGFPGESEENFNNTLRLVRETVPARVHIFPYSRREGTAASGYKDEVRHEDIVKRRTAAWVLALEASYLYRLKFVSKALPVLVETRRDRRTGMLEGYSDNYVKVIFNGPDSLMGAIADVRIDYMTLSTTVGAIAR